jgi:hypothetical protein
MIGLDRQTQTILSSLISSTEAQDSINGKIIPPKYEPFEYSAAQRDIFFDGAKKGRFRIHPKGRRLGATRGAAHAFIEFALWGYPLMWGDVTQSNLDRYVERMFIPAMRKRNIKYKWSAQKKVLKIGDNGGYIDFRSAQNPENWEGFAYQVIFINEAGLVLEDEYLYYNAVLPMLMDFPNSQLIAAGTPKGRNLFYKLWQKCLDGESGYYGKRYTTYDNPWMSPDEIQRTIDNYPQEAISQEIMGEFSDIEESVWRVIPREWVTKAMDRWKAVQQPEGTPDAIGVDPARGGKDKTVLAPRWGNYVGEIKSYPGKTTPDGAAVAALVMQSTEASTAINVDVIGIGSSVYDHLKDRRDYVHPVNGAARSSSMDKTRQFKFRNLRAQLYWELREKLDPSTGLDLALPPDEQMLEDLCTPTWRLTPNGIQVQAKDEISAALSRSPDKGDAVVYAFYDAKPRYQQVVLKKPRGWYG